MATWRLEKKFRFEASHELPHHPGKCRRLHGHSWVGVAMLEANNIHADGPEAGMVVDFGILGERIDNLVESHLDHWHLNETTGLENPTSEELARWVYERLVGRIPFLVGVRIEETCTSACEYWPEAGGGEA